MGQVEKHHMPSEGRGAPSRRSVAGARTHGRWENASGRHGGDDATSAIGQLPATVLVVALGLAGTFVVYLVVRQRGQAAAIGRGFWLMMAGMSIVAGISAWALTTGRPAVGIALLVAAFVLPELVLLPLRIRRSRAAAEAARETRRKRRPAP